MTALPRYTPRRGQVPYWLIALSLLAAVVAVVPIAAAVFTSIGGGGPRTAFAAAPAGSYAVVVGSENHEDVVSIVPASGDSPPVEVVRIAHLPGFATRGAVSPGGTHLAVVVVDAGTATRPVASLQVVDLETGDARKIAGEVDVDQTPVWTPAGSSVIYTRTVASGAVADVAVIEVATSGGAESERLRMSRVLGAYPVGHDADGQLLTVRIDGHGSSLLRGGDEWGSLSSQITRDWRVSPDGTQLAFIETDLSAGLRYQARSVSLAAAPGTEVASQTFSLASAPGQQLGVAWKPGEGTATFGQEPASAAGEVASQAAGTGFDVPLGYAPDGRGLVVQAWSGSSFAQPGTMHLTLVSENGRVALPGVTRFFGWAGR